MSSGGDLDHPFSSGETFVDHRWVDKKGEPGKVEKKSIFAYKDPYIAIDDATPAARWIITI